MRTGRPVKSITWAPSAKAATEPSFPTRTMRSSLTMPQPMRVLRLAEKTRSGCARTSLASSTPVDMTDEPIASTTEERAGSGPGGSSYGRRPHQTFGLGAM